MNRRKALITGLAGQDGSYLAKKLLDDGYEVFGAVRSQSHGSLERLARLGILGHKHLNVISWDLADRHSTLSHLEKIAPDEIYNLASHSFVADSIKRPNEISAVSALAVVNLLSAIEESGLEARFFQAGSSEMFGDARTQPQNEDTPFHPRNLYGSAKAFAHFAVSEFRSSLGVFASSAILFNHESPLRGEEFVTRKVTMTVAKIKLGLAESLSIGNLSSVRDWGFAPEYVDAMRSVISNDEPSDFVLATGSLTSVRDFISSAFATAGIGIEFNGEGQAEKGFDTSSGKVLVSVDPNFYRPKEGVPLVGNPEKAKQILGWEAKTSVSEIVRLMVEGDIDYLTSRGK
jgi:GDPmannose 4,6-dehydratase